jgi:hypothetical protein
MKTPKITIDGVPRSLKFGLCGMQEHLMSGGLVKIVFNADGTYFTANKIKKEKKDGNTKNG